MPGFDIRCLSSCCLSYLRELRMTCVTEDEGSFGKSKEKLYTELSSKRLYQVLEPWKKGSRTQCPVGGARYPSSTSWDNSYWWFSVSLYKCQALSQLLNMPPLAACSHKLSVLGWHSVCTSPVYRWGNRGSTCTVMLWGPTKNHATCASKPCLATARPKLCSVSQSLEEKALRPCWWQTDSKSSQVDNEG